MGLQVRALSRRDTHRDKAHDEAVTLVTGVSR